MKRSRAAILSLAIAVAAIAGVFALDRSLALGVQARESTTADVARRSGQLDRYEASLVSALAKRPPPLPRVPNAVARSSASTPVERLVYRRLPTVAPAAAERGGDEHEYEDEHEHEHEREGTEDDD